MTQLANNWNPGLGSDLEILPIQNEAVEYLKKQGFQTIGDLYNVTMKGFISKRIVPLAFFDDLHAAYHWIELQQSINNIFEYDEEDWDLFDYDREAMKEVLGAEVTLSPDSEQALLRQSLSIAEIRDIGRTSRLEKRDRMNVNFLFNYLHKAIGARYKSIGMQPVSKAPTPVAELEDFINEILASLDARAQDVLKRRLGIWEKAQTLENIGKEIGVTRERIRQIQLKSEKRIQKAVRSKIDWILARLPHRFVSQNPGMLLILIDALLKNEIYRTIGFDEPYIYMKAEEAERIAKAINGIDATIKSKGFFLFSDNQSELTKVELDTIFESRYLINEDSIIDKISKTKAVEAILKEANRPINMGIANDVRYVCEKLKEKYNIDILENSESVLPDSKLVRNLEAKLAAVGVLWNDRTFIHPDNMPILPDALNVKIKDEIARARITTAKNLFETFEYELRQFEMKYPLSVYGYMKFFFPNEYFFGGVNGLITMPGENNSWAKVVSSKIKVNGRPVSYDEISGQYPALTKTIWANIPMNHKELLSWGNGHLYHVDYLEMLPQEKRYIYSYIQEQHMVGAIELFIQLQQHHPGLLERTKTTDETILVKLVLMHFRDFIDYDDKSQIYSIVS